MCVQTYVKVGQEERVSVVFRRVCPILVGLHAHFSWTVTCQNMGGALDVQIIRVVHILQVQRPRCPSAREQGHSSYNLLHNSI